MGSACVPNPPQHHVMDSLGRPQPESTFAKQFEEEQGQLEIGAAGDLGASLAWWGIRESPFDAAPDAGAGAPAKADRADRATVSGGK